MAKITSEFDFSNTIKVLDLFTATNTYYVNNKQVVTSFVPFGYIDAGAQNDIIDASAIANTGNTFFLLGGSGKDRIMGGLSDDVIDGGADADIVDAGGGNDRVAYDPVDTYVNGGFGFDTLDAYAAGSKGKGVTIDLASTKDAYIGFEGIVGSAYADSLTGDDGSNTLDGGDGNDFLYGGGGNDIFFGRAGADTMDGGAGDDEFFVEHGTDHPAGETIVGGDGYDTISFHPAEPGETLILEAVESAEVARIVTSVDDSTIDASRMPNTAAIDLYGGDGDNRLVGNGAANYISGAGGNDFIDGGPGGDTIDAGDGDDTVVYDASYSFVDGGLGTDTINASGATDGVTIDLSSGSGPYVNFENITGGTGNDSLTGDHNVNVLAGGAGNDNLTGMGDGDIFVLSPGDDVIQDFQLPGPTDVLFDFEAISPGASFDTYKGVVWSNANTWNPNWYPDYSGGYGAVLNSGTLVVYDGGAAGLSFSRSDDFDLASGYFAAAWNNDLTVTIAAWDDGQQVGTATLQMDPVKVFVDFAAGTAAGADSASFDGRFDSIDFVTIDGSGGTNAGSGGWGEFVAMDDLTLTVTAGDRIAVPGGIDIDAMVASAQSDGNGGTLLTHELGTLTLVGIDPGTVNADFFV